MKPSKQGAFCWQGSQLGAEAVLSVSSLGELGGLGRSWSSEEENETASSRQQRLSWMPAQQKQEVGSGREVFEFWKPPS